MRRKSLILTTAAAAAMFAGAANATEYEVMWSGAEFGNSATGAGFFDIDTSVLPNLSAIVTELPDPAFQILSVTISGASTGNGTFGASDFDQFYFWSPGPLDLNTKLIGQSVGAEVTFGNLNFPNQAGDFNIFSTEWPAPTGVFYFTLETSSGDELAVTSIAPVVPEPSTWAMLLLGFAGLGFAGYRGAKASTAALSV